MGFWLESHGKVWLFRTLCFPIQKCYLFVHLFRSYFSPLKVSFARFFPEKLGKWNESLTKWRANVSSSVFVSLSEQGREPTESAAASPAHWGPRRERVLFLMAVTQDYWFLCSRHNARKDLVLWAFIIPELKQKARVRTPTSKKNTALCGS